MKWFYTGSPLSLELRPLLIEKIVQEVPLYHKCLHRVKKPLQVKMSTQTSVGYNEYTNLFRLYQSQSR